ncbi:MAG: TatD family hydrolase [Candidatus Jorgensenbacteria bacterium]
MKLLYFDAHSHAQFAAYDADREAVIARARAAGVGMVNAGTNRATSEAAIALAEANPDLCWATVGLHPLHAFESGYHDPQELTVEAFSNSRELENGNVFDFDAFKKLAAHPKVVAVGECGLDYAVFVRERSERLQKRALATPTESASELSAREIEEIKIKQKEAFIEQIKLAHEIQKPLVIHCRSAFPDLIALLTTHYQLLTNLPGLIHFFSGTADDAQKFLDMGFYFTFGGVITFVRDYDEVVKMIPSERILFETDAPYVAPAPYRGKRNEPAYVVEVVKKLAELKGVSAEEMSARTLKNARRVFGILT